MRIDTDSPAPIFQQIIDQLTAAVAAGVYKPGELVPSVRQMALQALVNPNTVQRAYEYLEREGILLSKRGSGMAVADAAPKLARAKSSNSVRTHFTSAIQAGLSASLSRTAIDTLYRQSWNGHSDDKAEKHQ
jgi:GntR family transcriptional regulator